MTGTSANVNRWTVAYRNPRANRFLRVDDLSLTWEAASEIGVTIAQAHKELEWYVVPTAADEQAGRVDAEDVGNILVDHGPGKRTRRVQIKEGGKLPADVADLVTVVSTEPAAEQPAAEQPAEQPAAAPETAEEAAPEQPQGETQSAAEEPTEDAESADEPTVVNEVETYTVAYRSRKANRFRRVPGLSLTEDEALQVATKFVTGYPTYEVYSVWTKAEEQAGHVEPEDAGYLTTVEGKRVRMTEDGVLPEEIKVPGAPAKQPAAPKPARQAAKKNDVRRPVVPPVDGLELRHDRSGGKRDITALVNGKVVAKAVGYNDTKPNGSKWFKGWKIMVDGKQVDHVVFQVGVAKAELRLQQAAQAALAAAPKATGKGKGKRKAA